jgi:hypothetical protein
MRRSVTIQVESEVWHRLGSLSNADGGLARVNRSLNQWLADYALPRFCRFEEQRRRRRKARINR